MDKPERIWNVTSGRPIRTETPKAPVVPPKAILGSYARTCFICFSVIVVSRGRPQALARCLREAIAIAPRQTDRIPSTKGSLQG
jgi:hypothetical protein